MAEQNDCDIVPESVMQQALRLRERISCEVFDGFAGDVCSMAIALVGAELVEGSPNDAVIEMARIVRRMLWVAKSRGLDLRAEALERVTRAMAHSNQRRPD